MSPIPTSTVSSHEPSGVESRPDLSVVVPAYNEGIRLQPSLRRIFEYLRASGRSFEVLVVDDGSRDDTVEVARGFQPEAAVGELLVLCHRVNRGKGAALRTGVLASQGARVLLSDADLSTPIEDLERLEPHLEDRDEEPPAELAIGSRAVAEADITHRQPFYREIMGKVFNLVIRLSGVRGIRDTQCGFKLLDGDVARELFAAVTIDRFAYDVELIWLARRQGYRVAEVGVRWANSEDSRVHPIRDSLSMLRDVLRFRFRHRGSPRPATPPGTSP